MGRKQVLKRNYDNEGKIISKECSCCHKIKPISEFNKDETTVDGFMTRCKECLKKYRQENKEHKKEYDRKYRQENKDKINEYQKKYKQENKEYQKEYYKDNTESIKKHQKEYYKDNAENIKKHRKEYYKDNAENIKECKKEYYTKKAQESLQQIKIEVESNPDKYNYIKGKDIYGIIYLVHNINSDKYYVGQTTVGFDNRYSSGWLYYHRNKESIKEDLQLYGENSFEYVKLFKVAHSQYELDKLEAYYIDYYNSYENGYNETRGNIFTDRGKEK